MANAMQMNPKVHAMQMNQRTPALSHIKTLTLCTGGLLSL